MLNFRLWARRLLARSGCELLYHLRWDDPRDVLHLRSAERGASSLCRSDGDLLMGPILILVGFVILIAAFRGEETTLAHLVASDIEGMGGTSFVWWILAVAAVGAVGYIPAVRPLAISFLALIILGVVLANEGLFADLENQLSQITSGALVTPSNADFTSWAEQIGGSVQSGSGSGGGGGLFGSVFGGGSAGSDVATAATVAAFA